MPRTENHLNCPRFGALLYGRRCVGCDCHLADLADGGPIPAEWKAPHVLFDSPPCREHSIPIGRVTGFDVSSGPDQSARVTMQKAKVGDRYEYRFEDIELTEDPRIERIMAEQAEMLRRHSERVADAMYGRAMYGDAWTTDPPWHFNCRSTMRETACEIITDPADRRGIDARRVG